MTSEWSFLLDGYEETIKRDGDFVFVNSKKYYLNRYLIEDRFLEKSYHIPLEGADVVLYYQKVSINQTITVNGIDLFTGKAYIPSKVPFWEWIFIAVYVIGSLLATVYLNQIFLIGEAISIPLLLGFIVILTSLAAACDLYQKLIVRVLYSLLILIVWSVVFYGVVAWYAS